MAHYQDDKWYPRLIVGDWYEDEDDNKDDGVITLIEQPRFEVRHTVFLNKVRNRTLLALPGMSRLMMDRLYEAAHEWYVFPDSEPLKVAYPATNESASSFVT